LASLFSLKMKAREYVFKVLSKVVKNGDTFLIGLIVQPNTGVLVELAERVYTSGPECGWNKFSSN